MDEERIVGGVLVAAGVGGLAYALYKWYEGSRVGTGSVQLAGQIQISPNPASVGQHVSLTVPLTNTGTSTALLVAQGVFVDPQGRILGNWTTTQHPSTPPAVYSDTDPAFMVGRASAAAGQMVNLTFGAVFNGPQRVASAVIWYAAAAQSFSGLLAVGAVPGPNGAPGPNVSTVRGAIKGIVQAQVPFTVS